MGFGVHGRTCFLPILQGMSCRGTEIMNSARGDLSVFIRALLSFLDGVFQSLQDVSVRNSICICQRVHL